MNIRFVTMSVFGMIVVNGPAVCQLRAADQLERHFGPEDA